MAGLREALAECIGVLVVWFVPILIGTAINRLQARADKLFAKEHTHKVITIRFKED